MGQVMNYHQNPPSFEYDGISFNWNNLNSVVNNIHNYSRLMKIIADSTNTTFGFDDNGYGYGETTKSNMIQGFQHFGYSISSSSLSSCPHSPGEIANQIINYGNPVLLIGANSSGSGHSWVCDGAKKLVQEEFWLIVNINLKGITIFTRIITLCLIPISLLGLIFFTFK